MQFWFRHDSGKIKSNYVGSLILLAIRVNIRDYLYDRRAKTMLECYLDKIFII